MKFDISSEPGREYAAMLDAADSLGKLREALTLWDAIAGDAVDVVAGWSESDFTAWRGAMALERRGKYMGDELAARFMAVLLPATMFRISSVASQFGVPWTVARQRLLDTKLLRKRGRRLVFADQPR